MKGFTEISDSYLQHMDMEIHRMKCTDKAVIYLIMHKTRPARYTQLIRVLYMMGVMR